MILIGLLIIIKFINKKNWPIIWIVAQPNTSATLRTQFIPEKN